MSVPSDSIGTTAWSMADMVRDKLKARLVDSDDPEEMRKFVRSVLNDVRLLIEHIEALAYNADNYRIRLEKSEVQP